MLVGAADSGLGLLRSERTVSESFSELPPGVRARALEPDLLIVTKANRRSTVHRPVYLDYVGVKEFDRSGRVVGESRFIGLLRGLGLHAVGRGHPRDRRPGPPRARDPGVQPGLARRARPDGLPGDLPPRRAVRHRQRGAGGHGRGRAEPQGAPRHPAVPAPGHLRAIPLLPGVPPPGPVHHRRAPGDPGGAARGGGRRERRLHRAGDRVGPGPPAHRGPDGARPVGAGGRPGRAGGAGSPRWCGPGTTSWPTPWSPPAPRRGARPARRLPAGVPAVLPRGHPGRRGGRGPRRDRAAHRRGAAAAVAACRWRRAAARRRTPG